MVYFNVSGIYLKNRVEGEGIRMKVKKIVLIAGVSIGLCLAGTKSIQADEVTIFERPNPDNAQILLTDENVKNVFTISAENQELINQAIQMDSANEDYINSIIDSYKVEKESTEEQYNLMIEEAVNGLLYSNDEYNPESNGLIPESKSSETQRQGRIDPITAARLAYDAGILIVAKKPAPQTALYMTHARVLGPWSANPKNITHSNDAWSKQVALDNGLNGALNVRFFNEVYGKQSFTLNGYYEFKHGDPAYALAHVSYSVTFVRQSNGGYKATYRITDKYDFAKGNYDKIAVGFGNNYCYAMQKLGLIKTFNISITYKQ